MMKRLLSLMLFLLLGCTGLGILAISPGMTVNAASETPAIKAADPTEPIAQGTFGTCRYTVDQDGRMTIAPEEANSGMLGPASDNPWHKIENGAWTFPSWVSQVTTIQVAPGVRANSSSYNLFLGFKNVKTINLNNLDMRSVQDMSSMFEDCSNLEGVKFPITFQSNSATDMGFLFKNCTSLETADLSDLGSASLTDIRGMFEGCENLKAINWGQFDTSKVTSMSLLFFGCRALTNLDLSPLKTGEVKEMYAMFDGCKNVQTINFDGFNTENVQQMGLMFARCSSLKNLDLGHFNTSSLEDLYGMFTSCVSLEKLDLSNFNTDKVVDMGDLFFDCQNLTSLNISSLNTQNVINFVSTFARCNKLQALNLTNFNTKNALSQNPHATYGMFAGTPNLWQLDLGKDTQLGEDSELISPAIGTEVPDDSGFIARSGNWQAVVGGSDHAPRGPVYSTTALANLTSTANFSGGRFVWEQTTPGSSGSGSSSSQPETSTPQPAPSPQPTPAPAPTPENPETPATTPGQNEATTKQQVVYAVKGLYLYQRPTFNKGQRLVRYPKQKRINRPMFIVTGYARSANGALRYKVRDINPTRRTFGKVGYVTANDSYVKPAYYQTLPKSRRVTVIATKGVNAYRTRNLTGKVSHYKRGRQLQVKKLVKSGLTTRYQLTNGRYISGNKLLVIHQN